MTPTTKATLCLLAAASAVMLQSSGDSRGDAAMGVNTTTAMPQNAEDDQEKSIIVNSKDGDENSQQDPNSVVPPHQEILSRTSKDGEEQTSKQDRNNVVSQGERQDPQQESIIVTSKEKTDDNEGVGIGVDVDSQVEVRIEILDYSQRQGADKEWKFQSFDNPPRRFLPMRGYTASAIRVGHPKRSSMEATGFVWALKHAAEHEDLHDAPSQAKPFAQHVEEHLQKEKEKLREAKDSNGRLPMVRFVVVGYEARSNGTNTWHQLYAVVPQRLWALLVGADATGPPGPVDGAPWLARDGAEYVPWAVRNGLSLPIPVVDAALRRDCDGQKRWFARWRPAFRAEQHATRKALGQSVPGEKEQEATWSALVSYMGRFCENVRDSWEPRQMEPQLRVYSALSKWLMKHNCVSQECVDQVSLYSNVARIGVTHAVAYYLSKMWLPVAAGGVVGQVYEWMFAPKASASLWETLWWYIRPSGWFAKQKLMIASTTWMEGAVGGGASMWSLVTQGLCLKTMLDLGPKASDEAWDSAIEEQTRVALDALITIEWERAVFEFEGVGPGDVTSSDVLLQMS